MHWIDSETQAFLDTLVESLPTARLLVLVNYRPEYHHAWTSKTYYAQIRLDTLPEASAADLRGMRHGAPVRAAGVVEMSIGLHAARIRKPFLLPAHHLYWTRAALLAAIIFGLPRLTFLAPAINSNAFDAVLLLPISLAAGCFWMLGRGYGAPGIERDALLDTVRGVLREMGYSARESFPRSGEDEFMLLGVGHRACASSPPTRHRSSGRSRARPTSCWYWGPTTCAAPPLSCTRSRERC